MQQGATAKRLMERKWAGIKVPALLFAVCLTCTAAFAGQQIRETPAPPAQGLREPPRLTAEYSIDRAIEAAEKRHRARVVRAEEVVVQGRRIYVLRMLSDEGRVWTVRVDAESGAAR